MALNTSLLTNDLKDYIARNFKISNDIALNPLTSYITGRASDLNRFPGSQDLFATPRTDPIFSDPRYADKINNLFNSQSFFNEFGGRFGKNAYDDAPASLLSQTNFPKFEFPKIALNT